MPATFKGLRFSDRVAPFVRHMDSMNDHRENLVALRSAFDTLSLLGHLSNLKANLAATRSAFESLTTELMATLADESLARVVFDLDAKAQVAIDILVRSLFERTADIGFLASDDAVIAACHSGESLTERFRLYAQRYSVYQDVVLLSPEGQVLSRMRPGMTGVSHSPIVAQALSSGSYVETHAATDFLGGPALSYAAAVTENHQALGVLVLHFDLDGESELIFNRLLGTDHTSEPKDEGASAARSDCGRSDCVVGFVDANGRVLVSSDSASLPAGYRLPRLGPVPLMRIGGRSYVASMRAPQPYQGYAGPGWSCVALLPVDRAFEAQTKASTSASGVRLSGQGVFAEALLDIPRQAQNIQHQLDLVVWNGRLSQRASGETNGFSRALLREISSTGLRTKGVFESATAELLDTVSNTLLDEARFMSGLAVEILDRNLYERACDCRWWTHNAKLSTLDPEVMAPVLRHIHSLYTVYTELVVFDTEGRIVCASADPQRAGQHLREAWVTDCLRVTDGLGYVVSPFEASPISSSGETYIYAAPLREHGASGRVVGGIGLVFDSIPQLRAMLEAALPARPGAVGAYLRPDGTVLVQTAEMPLPLPSAVRSLGSGASWSAFIEHQGTCYAVSATAGSGYREFKTTDGYDEGVVALVVVPCGAPATATRHVSQPLRAVEGGVEVATFLIGDQLLGIESAAIEECIEVRRSVSSSGFGKPPTRHCGYTTWRDAMLPLVDLSETLGAARPEGRHAIVMAHDGYHFGLLVSSLGAIVDLEVCDSPVRVAVNGGGALIARLARSGSDMVPLLSPASVAAASIAQDDAQAA